MKIERATPVNEFLAKLLFLLLPTAGVAYFFVDKLQTHFAIIQNQSLLFTLYFLTGMVGAALLYSFRLRFLPTFASLLAVLYTLYKGIDAAATGEFDAFFIARQFEISAILFTLGWVAGWGYIRLRYFAIVISGLFLAWSIAIISMSKLDSVPALLWAIMPALTYAVYNIFTAEQIYNYKDKSSQFWWYLIRRVGLFAVLLLFTFAGVLLYMQKDIKAVVANFGAGGKGGSAAEGLLKKNQDNTFDIRDYSKLSSSLSRSKELLFCAHINNFFPGTKIPNPLYLTAYYFTKFDTATETFERDSLIPKNDLFLPDPSKIPLFGTVIDTNVIRNSLGYIARDIVDVEIYNCKLSPKTYLAPNVGFFVQPITVEKDFRQKFVSAYRAKSYVSTLNSAYFVYNVDTPAIRNFQEARFRILREVKNYYGVDSTFLAYYTRMPQNKKFAYIDTLAHLITDTAATPVDKVLAIKNYFLSKDDNGKPLYKYTDNPGEPDIPSASKLMYFLKQSHKGYCAYYAGATLFMLRAVGIPSRITVGFLTEDRSDKNKGWYWYYANQAHAWVQVYFPGYGWLDFDNTVGNTDENRPTPQPDGTPPMQPPKAWFAAEGKVESVDTVRKTAVVTVKKFVFQDKEYVLKQPTEVSADLKVATIYKDSLAIPLNKVSKGEEGTLVSYAEDMKTIQVKDEVSAEEVMRVIPKPTPIDEVYLKVKPVAKPKPPAAKPPANKAVPVKEIYNATLTVIGLFIFVLFSLPYAIYRYYKAKYKQARGKEEQAWWAFRTATFYLHLTADRRIGLTPMQYAVNVVDKKYGTQLANFMTIFLKKKYANQPLTAGELNHTATFLAPFLQTVGKQIKPIRKIAGFLNPFALLSYYRLPTDEKEM